jgi:hypothetical protein
MIITNEEELAPYLHNRKASEVFLEYAEPYLQILLKERDDIPSNKELEKILKLPWCIWNKVVSEEKDPGKVLADLLKYADSVYTYNMPPGAAKLMEDLKQRKKTDFKQYKYFLGNYKVYKKEEIITLNIQHYQQYYQK